jgi:acetylornithine deacetylase/succinyl-diaminopimelate desuccinylase-like protein
MIFVPSLNHGVSHAPEELSRYEDIALGVDVLIGSIRRLDAAL